MCKTEYAEGGAKLDHLIQDRVKRYVAGLGLNMLLVTCYNVLRPLFVPGKMYVHMILPYNIASVSSRRERKMCYNIIEISLDEDFCMWSQDSTEASVLLCCCYQVTKLFLLF